MHGQLTGLMLKMLPIMRFTSWWAPPIVIGLALRRKFQQRILSHEESTIEAKNF